MKKKIKILVITSSFPRNQDDWWAQFIISIYRYMPKDKFAIIAIAPHSSGALRNEIIGNIKVIRFPYFYPYRFQKLTSGSGVLHASRESFLGKLQIGFFVMSQLITALFISNRDTIDIVHAHWILPQGFTGIIIKFILRKKLIITGHGTDIFGLKKYNWIKKIILEQSDVVTVNSTIMQNALKKIGYSNASYLIPMGVDTKLFSPNKKNQVFKKKLGRSKIILSVGRLIPCKGFDFLLKAMPKVIEKYKDVNLVIVGSGPQEQSLLLLAQKLKLTKHVTFMGSLSHKELASFYASSDIFIAPSVTDPVTGETEGQNITILEAFASGVPVIASASGGITDMVDGKSTGLLVEEGNPDDIAQKVIFLLSNPDYRKRLCLNSLKLVKEKYGWGKISEDFSKLYTKLIVN